MYITISGAHGVGKTSICKLLAKRNCWEHIPETLDTTIAPPVLGPEGNPLLGQLWFLRQMILREKKIRTIGFDSVIVADRIWNDLYVYSKSLLSEDEFKIFDSIASSIPKKLPTLEIVLWANNEIIVERIKNRNRNNIGEWGEDNLTYLVTINGAYKKYYEDFKDLRPIFLVEASGGLEETYEKVKTLIEIKMK